MKKIIRLISLFLDRFPVLRLIKDKLVLIGYKQLYRLRTRLKGHDLEADRQIIDVRRIKLLLNSNLPVLESMGTIQAGDWDVGSIPIEGTDTNKALVAHFDQGKPWTECEYYQRVCGQVSAGEVMWGCKTEQQVKDRFMEIDRLYDSVSKVGMLSADQWSDSGGSSSFISDILVCIDRNGDYILHDGMHRLIIARLLDVKQVPVRVSFRHRSWQSFCEDVRAYEAYHNKLYAPVLHPDLNALSANHGHERFEAIKRHLPKEPGTVLDIGSHWGYFCHKLESEGFKCTAMEPDAKNLYFLRALRRAEHKTFSVIDKGIFDVEVKANYDMVLALYVFHHFLKLEVTYNQLIEFLQSLEAKVMFFAAHSPDEPQMKGAYINYEPEDFADFILEHSNFTRKECIWTEKEGRRLYKLS